MNTFDFSRNVEADSSEEVYSKSVRAGHRTYFFDVKSTRGGDYYLTITESRRKLGKDGSTSYDKHKIYLYKEDFEKFHNGLEEVVNYIKVHKPEFFESHSVEESAMSIDEEFDKL
ncbi:MAG: PUR family DNA/RNA-binding protein [Rikenellaceae bacterium]|nr:PUR family DNA/RNA-binding protein [Rikenellaceae bacterium]